jgi:putative serine protease PepD
MKPTSLLALSLAVLAFWASPLRAQGDDDDDRPARPQATAEPQVEGRNEALCKAFTDVAGKASNAVVSVGSAYGVVLDGGIIVTTADAVKGARSVAVKGAGISGDARVLGIDDANGIAVLEAPASSSNPKRAASFALESHPALGIGQFVISVGNKAEPLAVGVLSAKDRKVEPKDISQANVFMELMSDGLDGPKRAFPKVLQHDGPMNEETLGSALVDSSGRLVGVNVGTGFRGSSYALAVDDIAAAVNAIKSGKTPEPPRTETKKTGRAYLGASVHEVDGALVVKELAPDGPAETAGLKPGDRIASLDSKKVATLDELASRLGKKQPGDKVSLEIVRGTERTTLEVVLGEKR